uniref:Transposase n=1 Tax=Romanomermis culicivorax TaxID=13658 RepID=A0A915KS57_ROMCU
MDNLYLIALQYNLQCLTDMRAPNYPVTEERKTIIRYIHQEHQIKIDKRAEIKKKKNATTLFVAR